MYTANCRWYQGGPIGRIRFYEVPATNKQFWEDNIFWPWSESEAQCYNVTNPGQIQGRVTYDLGDNFRPDLTGQHFDGSPADFLGAPLPAVITPPECLRAPGMRLPLQFRAASTRGLAPYDNLRIFVRFWDFSPSPCLVWWLRPESITVPGGDPVLTWPNSDDSPNPGIGTGVPNAPLSNTRGVNLEQFAGLKSFNQIHRSIPFPPGPKSWYMVGGGALNSATHQGPAIGRGSPLLLHWTMDNIGITANVNTGSLSVATGYDPPYAIWSLKFDGVQLSFYQNGVMLASGTVPPGGGDDPIFFIITPQRGAGPYVHTITALSEFLLFDCVLSTEEDADVLRYLSYKYGIPIAPPNVYSGSLAWPLGSIVLGK